MVFSDISYRPSDNLLTSSANSSALFPASSIPSPAFHLTNSLTFTDSLMPLDSLHSLRYFRTGWPDEEGNISAGWVYRAVESSEAVSGRGEEGDGRIEWVSRPTIWRAADRASLVASVMKDSGSEDGNVGVESVTSAPMDPALACEAEAAGDTVPCTKLPSHTPPSPPSDGSVTIAFTLLSEIFSPSWVIMSRIAEETVLIRWIGKVPSTLSDGAMVCETRTASFR